MINNMYKMCRTCILNLSKTTTTAIVLRQQHMIKQVSHLYYAAPALGDSRYFSVLGSLMLNWLCETLIHSDPP